MNSSIKIVLLALVLTSSVYSADKTTLPKDWGNMSTTQLKYKLADKLPFFSAPFSFTYNKDSKDMKTQSVDFAIDFTTNDIIVGNKKTSDPKSSFDWGLDCSDEKSMCSTSTQAAVPGTYQTSKYNYSYKAYTTVSSLYQGVDLSESKGTIKVRMCENPAQFNLPYQKNGVMGLGP